MTTIQQIMTRGVELIQRDDTISPVFMLWLTLMLMFIGGRKCYSLER